MFVAMPHEYLSQDQIARYGRFPEELSVAERAVGFVADRFDVDPGCLPGYRACEKTVYEHAWQIRGTFGYRGFYAGEEDLSHGGGPAVPARPPRVICRGGGVGPKHEGQRVGATRVVFTRRVLLPEWP